MPEKTEKRRSFIIDVLYFALIIGLFYIGFKFAFSALAPFLIAFFIAICLQKPINAIERKWKKVNHSFVSILLFIVVFLIIVGPLAGIITAVISEISKFVKYVTDGMRDIPAFLTTVQNGILNVLRFLPENLYNEIAKPLIKFFTEMQNDFDFTKLGISYDSVIASISGLLGAAKSIPSVIIATVVSVISCIFFTKDYRAIVNFITRQFSEKHVGILRDTKKILFSTMGKMVRAYGIIMSITFLQLFIGLSALKLFGIYKGEYLFVISLFTALFDIIPILGAGGILIPWALYSLIVGNFKMAIGLMVIYLIIYILRQYLEPKIVGVQLGVHPIITLIGLFVGLKLFGFMGMLIVPFSIMLLKALNDAGTIQVWHSSIEEQTPEQYKKKNKKQSIFSKLLSKKH